MGLYTAKSAILFAAHEGLGHAATRLLVHMALECLDTPDARGRPARRYFGGRTMQAHGLGYRGDAADTPAAHQAVKRAVAELTSFLAIERRRSARMGAPTEWELMLHSDLPSEFLIGDPRGWEVDGHRTPVPVESRTRGVRLPSPTGGR